MEGRKGACIRRVKEEERKFRTEKKYFGRDERRKVKKKRRER